MIPEQTLLGFPLFGDNATKVEPDNNKKSNGWQQGDVVPAEWMNWEWYHASKGVADLNKGVSSMEKEINAVLASFGITPAELTNNQLLTAMRLNNSFLTATGTTITGPLLVSGGTIRVVFTAAIAGSDTTTGLTISYNGQTNIPVMVYKEGTLEAFTAAKISWENANVVYKYLDKGTTLELMYNGTQFVIVNDPVVFKTSQYVIHADGNVEGGAIGDVKPTALTSIPYGWLECNGQAVSRSEFLKLFNFFSNEKYDGTNTLLSRYGTGNGSTTFNLPDYREVALVGAGQNGSDSIATHDVYTVGFFRDDRIQNIKFNPDPNNYVVSLWSGGASPESNSPFVITDVSGTQFGTVVNGNGKFCNVGLDASKNVRAGSTTRTKQKGVKYIIKVL